jgi:nucleoside-diphosphate-sugar epimerase
MRVAEGHAQAPRDDLSSRPVTPYAQANAENERVWLGAGGGPVLRLVNYLCPPAAVDSPQALLLPWSLVVDGARDRRIDVRSGPSEAKEFVSADDAASACVMLLGADAPPSIVSTVPGALFTMRSMAMTAADALVTHGFVRPEVSFGPDGDGVGPSLPGWLAAQGWAVSLSKSGMSSMVSTWVGDRKTGLLAVSL